MLTKELLHYTLRKQRVYPHALDPECQDTIAMSKKILNCFSECVGKTEHEMEEKLQDAFGSLNKKTHALSKLLFDRCEFSEPSADIEIKRWDVILAAETLRTENLFNSVDHYRAMVAQTNQTTPQQVDNTLYSDLPEFKKITEFSPLSEQALIHRYNCAQIQGLLIRARSLSLKIEDLDIGQKRTFFRLLRFYQIIAKVKKTDAHTFELELSGPLAIFDGASSYGMRLANFFPYVLQLSKFSLTALIKLPKGDYSLIIDQSLGIKSHYEYKGGYVPDTFSAVRQAFLEKYQDLTLDFADDFCDLGHQSYCFPDFVLKHKNSTEKPLYIELFHKWHISQLRHRIETVEKQNYSQLRIGVCQSLLKKSETKAFLESSEIFKIYGFTFNDFPTCKQLAALG